ncbi:10110_t:CDS:2, partial [Funneliformis geosporum]
EIFSYSSDKVKYDSDKRGEIKKVFPEKSNGDQTYSITTTLETSNTTIVDQKDITGYV